MRLTISKYILNEIWPTLLVSLFVSVFIIMTTKMLSITELIVSRGVRISQVAGMVIYLLPDIIAFALPAACLIAVVVAFLRLSADSEIIALKSSGISLYQMLPPVAALSFVAFLAAIVVSFVAVPWGNRSFKDLVFRIAESKADLGIEERIFCEPFDDVIFYVNSFSSHDRVMKDVFVVDKRDRDVTNTIIAQEGRIFLHPKERIITLHFLRGTIFMAGKDVQSDKIMTFKTYDLNISLKDIMDVLASRKRAPKEMSARELIEHLEIVPQGSAKYNEIFLELMEKCSIPLAVFLMGIIGVPLGAQMRARGRSVGIGVSLVVFLVYYMCFAGTRSMCETGALAPAIGVWIPDLFLFISFAFLLHRVANEHSINFLPPFLLRREEL